MRQYPDKHWFCKNCWHGAEIIMGSIAWIQVRPESLVEVSTIYENKLKTEVGHVLKKLNAIKEDIAPSGDLMFQCERIMAQNKVVLQGMLDKILVGIQSDLVTKDVLNWSEIIAKELESKVVSVTDNMASVHMHCNSKPNSYLMTSTNRRKSASAT